MRLFRRTFLFTVFVVAGLVMAGCAVHRKDMVKKTKPVKERVVVKKVQDISAVSPRVLSKFPLNATVPEGIGEIGPVVNAHEIVKGSGKANTTICIMCSLRDLKDLSEEKALEKELNAEMSGLYRLQGSFDRFLLQMERPEVDRFVEGYLGSQKGHPRLMGHLRRAEALVGIAKRVLKEEGMPTALAYLPIIESGYQSSVRSRSHAVGYWQFVVSTARKYGLRVGKWVDERRDIERSTRAAARYLRSLYGMFGSWELALAAYNGGEGRIFRSLQRGGAKDFWSLRESGALRAESSEYVPRFLSVLKILTHASWYCVSPVEDEDPVTFYYKTGIPGGVPLRVVAMWSGVSEVELEKLNPSLVRRRVPPIGQGYVLRFPTRRSVMRIERYLKSRSTRRRGYPKKRKVIGHRVKRGETLSDIALRYGVSVSAIMGYNGIRDPHRIRPGTLLYIPPKMERERRSWHDTHIVADWLVA